MADLLRGSPPSSAYEDYAFVLRLADWQLNGDGPIFGRDFLESLLPPYPPLPSPDEAPRTEEGG